MDQAQKEKADSLLEEALEAAGVRDPRDCCRALLKELKQRDAEAYERAVRHFEDALVPGIADGELDPIAGWRDYARELAEWIAEGRTVEIDETGRSHPHDPAENRERLVLHLPRQSSEKALLVHLPRDPSPAQRASYDLLVAGRQTL